MCHILQQEKWTRTVCVESCNTGLTVFIYKTQIFMLFLHKLYNWRLSIQTKASDSHTETNNSKPLSISTFFFPNCCWVYHIINNLLCMLSKNCSLLHIFIQMQEFNTCCEEPWAGFHSYTDKPDLASFYKADGCPIRICKTESACSRQRLFTDAEDRMTVL